MLEMRIFLGLKFIKISLIISIPDLFYRRIKKTYFKYI